MYDPYHPVKPHFCQGTTILCFHVYQVPEAAIGGVLEKKMSLKFRKCQRKTPVLESLCNKVRPATLLKKDSSAVALFWNFKNGYFEEHLQTTAPECLRKLISLFVLGKPMLDGKQENWVTNTFYCKY